MDGEFRLDGIHRAAEVQPDAAPLRSAPGDVLVLDQPVAQEAHGVKIVVVRPGQLRGRALGSAKQLIQGDPQQVRQGGQLHNVRAALIALPLGYRLIGNAQLLCHGLLGHPPLPPELGDPLAEINLFHIKYRLFIHFVFLERSATSIVEMGQKSKCFVVGGYPTCGWTQFPTVFLPQISGKCCHMVPIRSFIIYGYFIKIDKTRK